MKITNRSMLPNRQKGAAVLLVSIVLLIGVTLITVFAARVGVLDQRIAANEYRHKEAQASAGAALDEASGFLDSNKNLYDGTGSGWTDCTSSTALQNTFPCSTSTNTYEMVYSTVAGTNISELAYTTTLSNGADSKSYLVFTTSASSGNILTAIGTGQSIDGSGQSTEQVSYSKGTIFVPGQVPPIMTPNISLSGGFTIVGNPNLDGAPGVYATVWATTVNAGSGGGSWQTCRPGDYKDGAKVCIDEYGPGDNWSGCDCDTSTDLITGLPDKFLSYRDAGDQFLGDDILDASVFPFPTNVFQFVFGMSKSDMETFVSNKGEHEASCDDVDFTSLTSPYVWITGDCRIGGAEYGDRTIPVVLIVEGNFSVTGGLNYWGLIYGMDAITLNSNSLVHGSVIAESPSKLTNGGYHQIWDPGVLDALGDDDLNSFLAKLKYSWTDK